MKFKRSKSPPTRIFPDPVYPEQGTANVIGSFLGKADDRLLLQPRGDNFDLIVEVFGGLRSLSFLTGVDPQGVIYILGCDYTATELNEIPPIELESALEFINGRRNAIFVELQQIPQEIITCPLVQFTALEVLMGRDPEVVYNDHGDRGW